MITVTGTKKEILLVSLCLSHGMGCVTEDDLKRFDIEGTKLNVSYNPTDLKEGEGMANYYGVVMFGPTDKNIEEGSGENDEDVSSTKDQDNPVYFI